MRCMMTNEFARLPSKRIIVFVLIIAILWKHSTIIVICVWWKTGWNFGNLKYHKGWRFFYGGWPWDVYQHDTVCKQEAFSATHETKESDEWSPVHKTWRWATLDNLYANQITSEWKGSWDRAGMKLHGWRKAYKNYLVLTISTRCIFFLVVIP
jgi:hypothetical protein